MDEPATEEATAMADGESSEPSDSEQMSGDGQADAADDEPTMVAKRSTDSEPDPGASASAPAEAPAEIADGPIAPVAKVFNSLWNPEITEKEIAQKIVGPTGGQNACANCHTLESNAWKHSVHQTSFQTRHRSDEARQILRNLDQRSMKFRNETCRECHYTSTVQRDRLRPIAGVSCESCHGPGEDWVEIHNRVAGEPDGDVLDWGSDLESEAQREARLEESRKKGMIHSGMLYAMAANCVRCHTVPNERLVNQGEHPAGSEFELVSWAQGDVRHNFLSSPGAPDDPSNAAASAERRRLLYVVGRVADLEHTLHNLVEIEEPGGAFHTAMVERANRLRGAVAEIVQATEIPELAFALKQVPQSIGTGTTIPARLPEVLRKAGRRFTARYTGAELGGLDPLIPSEHQGEPYRAQQ